MARVLLLLAGTSEARDFAERFQSADLQLVASLSGMTRDPIDYPCKTRIGGFGGAVAMAAWLRAEGAVGVVDATHPFATQISANAVEASRLAELPHLAVQRAAWEPGEKWQKFKCLADAVAALPEGSRAFAATGRGGVEAFASRTDVTFILRSIEPITGLPPHVIPVQGRPPFSLEEECAFMRAEAVTHLITKNAGGARPAKLEAAERLDIPVFSIAMPPPPPTAMTCTVDEALVWAARL